jgi:hypothetical protein
MASSASGSEAKETKSGGGSAFTAKARLKSLR